ncbi:MAG: bifunctional oligoribonuclease/PAP phosphatase NrnA [Thermotogota bacterium]|nr:bifunctional oligoribonuclease/PAP phosphatase NrnA [Thermotogota bacterium]
MTETGINGLKEYINTHNRFLIIGHIDPDGDCISSVLSLTYGLRRIQKNVLSAIDSQCPAIYEVFQPVSQIAFEKDISSEDFDAIITVDSSSPDRMGKYQGLMNKKPNFVIDHHVTNDLWGDYNWLDVEASSAAEMVYRFLKGLGIEYDPILATINLLGIQTDTGFFKYTNTGWRVMEIAAELIKQGANAPYNASMVLENNRVQEFYLLSEMAKKIKTTLDGTLIYSFITLDMLEKTGCTSEDAAGLIGELKSIKGVETAILFTEMDKEEIKVSFRSKKWFDVATIAIEYGGGGHQRASGCTVHQTMDQTINEVMNNTRKRMETVN